MAAGGGIADTLIGVFELQQRKFLCRLFTAERADRFGGNSACILVLILQYPEKAAKIALPPHLIDFVVCQLTHLTGAISFIL